MLPARDTFDCLRIRPLCHPYVRAEFAPETTDAIMRFATNSRRSVTRRRVAGVVGSVVPSSPLAPLLPGCGGDRRSHAGGRLCRRAISPSNAFMISRIKSELALSRQGAHTGRIVLAAARYR